MKIKITGILEKHLQEAHKLYNYYIVNSYANFEETEIKFSDFHINYKNIINDKLPYLVALEIKVVTGLLLKTLFI